jgi:hypothetical protein
MSLLCWIPLKEGIGDEDRVTLRITLIFLFFFLFGTKLSKNEKKIGKYSPHLDSDLSNFC